MRVHHRTVITWVKRVGKLLPDACGPESIPPAGELDELETFVGSKKTCIWLWTAVDHFKQGILGLLLGNGACRNVSTVVGNCADLAVL
jgi:transposase-like protein